MAASEDLSDLPDLPDLPQPATPAGKAGLEALLEDPGRAVVALDFDGTLAPIVDDPEKARIDPAAHAALTRIAPQVAALVIVTGRPAAVAVEYGRLAGAPGLDRLVVLGHYGLERWDAVTGRVRAPEVPEGVGEVRAALPGVLHELGAWRSSFIEDKGSAIAVHTRRAPDPDALLDRLREPLALLASAHGLVVEPGRYVLELRPAGMDKGRALDDFLSGRDVSALLFAGDDLGDLAAFDAVDRLRARGVGGLTVCSGSTEVSVLADRADVVVPGPPGVARLLSSLASAMSA